LDRARPLIPLRLWALLTLLLASVIAAWPVLATL